MEIRHFYQLRVRYVWFYWFYWFYYNEYDMPCIAVHCSIFDVLDYPRTPRAPSVSRETHGRGRVGVVKFNSIQSVQ